MWYFKIAPGWVGRAEKKALLSSTAPRWLYLP